MQIITRNLIKLSLFISLFFSNTSVLYGQQFEWATHIESLTSQVISYDITVGDNGASYVTGYFTGVTDFNPAQDTLADTALIQGKTFVAKYTSAGDVVWAKFLNAEGGGKNFGTAIKIHNDQLFIGGGFGAAGPTDTTDFDPGVGEFKIVPSNFNDPFVLKLDTAGNFVKVAHFAPFVANSAVSCIVTDLTLSQNGDVIAVGRFDGSLDFDPGPGTDSLASSGGDDIFVCKLDSNLNLLWAEKFGGSGDDQASGVALDPLENICFTGNFSSIVDFDPGPGTSELTATGSDIYISKLTPQGELIWVKQLSGPLNEGGSSIAVDTSGGVITVGTFNGSVDFDPGLNASFIDAGTYYNAFISKLDSSGNYLWAYNVGDAYTRGFDVATDIYNNIYFSGDFTGLIDINLGPQTQYLETEFSYPDGDMFLLKLDQNGTHNWAKHIGGTAPSEIIYGVEVDSNLNVYSTGQFQSPADFNTGQDTLFLYAQIIGTDAFIHKLSNCTQTFSNITVAVCESYLPPSGSILYTQSGVYNDVIDNAQGCDSVITIDLTILPGQATSSQISVTSQNCDYYISPSGNYTFGPTGVYVDTILNSVGCDSIVTINLTSNITLTTIVEAACEGYSSPSGNYYWVNSGIYIDTLTSVSGCDSLIEIDLTIYSPSNAIVNISSCNQYLSPSGNQIWTTSGVYQDTILNSNSCDSIITVDFELLSATSSSQNVTTCDGFLSPSGNHYWSISGAYNDTIQNSNGCDSVITFTVSILPSDTTFLNVSACDEYLSPSGIYVWNSSGIYTDTLLNGNGCDSILVVDLEILSTSTFQNVTSCDDYLSPSGLYLWNSSGIYEDTLININGCDSILVIDLEILSTSTSQNVTSCNEYLSPSGLYLWNATGIYEDTLININGCDSIITVDLEILNSSFSSQNITSCDGYQSPSGNYYWTNSGVYEDTILNSQGCDSIITTDLTIDSVVATITQLDDTTFLANTTSGTVQWLDCTNGITPIVGETGDSLVLTSNGSYAVIITEGACSDTSDCIDITELGLLEHEFGTVSVIFPNPTSKNVTIQLPEVSESVGIVVRNVLGELTFSGHYASTEEVSFECLGPSGCYLIEVTTEQFVEIHHLIKL
ncbi:MAG: T9SS type A sorting domain-containing protein [Crocinitomicaceae bacterium]